MTPVLAPPPITDDEGSSLLELADILKKHGMASRFGVCLIRPIPPMNPGEEFVEVVNTVERVEKRSIESTELFPGALETEWHFSPEKTVVASACYRCWDMDRWKHGRIKH